MGHPALVSCDQCPHPRAAHSPIDAQRCRISGCPCQGFHTPETAAEPEPQPNGVFLVIPDGYVMTVTLTPVEVSDAAA